MPNKRDNEEWRVQLWLKALLAAVLVLAAVLALAMALALVAAIAQYWLL